MIKVLEGLPANVLGVEAGGRVTDQDYEDVLVPAVREKRAAHDRLRFLYVLGDDFDGWDAARDVGGRQAWAQGSQSLGEDRHRHRKGLAHPRRKGVRMDDPGRVRVFRLDERDAATQWVAD